MICSSAVSFNLDLLVPTRTKSPKMSCMRSWRRITDGMYIPSRREHVVSANVKGWYLHSPQHFIVDTEVRLAESNTCLVTS